MTASIDEVRHHAHASEVACARSLAAILREAQMRQMALVLDDGRRAIIEMVDGVAVTLRVDGQLSLMPVLAIVEMLGEDGPAVVGRWCQRVLSGEPLSAIVHGYPEFFSDLDR